MRTFLVPTYKSKAVEATASSFTLESRPQYSHATLNGCAANIFRACHHFCLESFQNIFKMSFSRSPRHYHWSQKPVHPRNRYSYIGRAITIWFENIDLMVAFANAISVGFYFSPPVLLYARSAGSQHCFSSPWSVSLFSPHPKTWLYFHLLFFIKLAWCILKVMLDMFHVLAFKKQVHIFQLKLLLIPTKCIYTLFCSHAVHDTHRIRSSFF